MVNHIGTHGASKRESVVRMGLQPGLYRSLSNEDYHADPSISKSKLDVIAGASPLHYWSKYLAPDREQNPPTPQMILGSAVHTAVLEPDLFQEKYAEAPECDRRTREGKQIWSNFLAETDGKTPVTAGEYRKVIAMRDAVFRCKAAWSLFEKADREESYIAADPETGLMIRARPDAFDRATGVMVDLKTTADASPADFARSAVTHRYHVQGAWYPYVVTLTTRETPRDFLFVAVESAPPWAVGIYHLLPEDYSLGIALAKDDLRRIADCERAGEWPDYSIAPQPLMLPAWYRRQFGVQ